MKRIRSAFRFSMPVALLLGTAALAPTITAPAFADDGSTEWKFVTQWKGSAGDDIVMYKDTETDRLLVEIWHDDGTYSVIIFGAQRQYGGSGDPGPDANNDKGIEVPKVAGMIAKGLITYTVKANPENTPLAKWIERDGGGIVTHWNNDDDKGRPGLPKVNNNEGGLTDKQKAEITRLVNYAAKTLGELGTSMGDGFDALGGESAPTFNKSGSSGRSKGTGTGEGSKNTGVYVPRDIDSLGARPDLVNPPHGKSGASGAMSPGLLDGGNSLSTNGPSGAGTAIGKGGGTTSRGIGAVGR